MKLITTLLRAISALAFALTAFPCLAADYPSPKEGDWIVRDFRFHTGEILPELKLHYATVGAPTGEPVLVLHGTTQSGAAMLAPAFAGVLFGPGQPLDASRYYVILPDAIGHGKSSKPSDGLRTGFPKYNYEDMVNAHYRLVTEYLGERYLLAASTTLLAAPIIIHTGENVMARGGYHGLNPVVTPEKLAKMVKARQIRFAMLGDVNPIYRRMGADAAGKPITDWIRTNGNLVPPKLWRSRGSGIPGGMELYDLLPDAGLVSISRSSPAGISW